MGIMKSLWTDWQQYVATDEELSLPIEDQLLLVYEWIEEQNSRWKEE